MDSPQSADFAELIARVARALADHEFPFMLIGGQAVLLHGEPRLTQDVDVTLGAPPERLEDALAVCRAARLAPLPHDVAAFVRDTFVLPVADDDSGARVDFLFSTTPYEAEAIRRAVHIDVAGTAVPFASAEDLVLHKLFAGRPRDLEDAAGVIGFPLLLTAGDRLNAVIGVDAEPPERGDHLMGPRWLQGGRQHHQVNVAQLMRRAAGLRAKEDAPARRDARLRRGSEIVLHRSLN
jgi:predicted nucleotidyltransferase